MNDLCNALKRLLEYGIYHKLLDVEEYHYAYNRLIDLLQFDADDIVACEDVDYSSIVPDEPSAILQPILDYAVEHHLIDADTVQRRDIFEAKVMDIIMPRPAQVIERFKRFDDSKDQTDYFYHLSQTSNYIKTARTNRNHRWQADTEYGTFDITINLSKPEKDPKDIIRQGKRTEANYPSCLLCKENVGYNGKTTGIGRTNHRIVPVTLNDEAFYLQYSPYVYYNEHCIVLQREHVPMNVTRATFVRLFDFVDQFPHYFLGSNAGLPIVGGSILSHEHYQGGRHTFPIERATVLESFELDDITFEQLHWPLSVIRLRGRDRTRLIDVAYKLFQLWETYDDPTVGIHSYTDGEPHNAITPIARKKGEFYELDMTLRNNLTSEEFPLGIFHPHPEHHHIKKENIGLIEVMGLAVLPGRLERELNQIGQIIVSDRPIDASLAHHETWIHTLKEQYDGEPIDAFLQQQVALKFVQVIEDAGVFKQDDAGQAAFRRFQKEVRHALG